MIIVMKPTSTKEDLERVAKKIKSAGLKTHLSIGRRQGRCAIPARRCIQAAHEPV